MAGHLEKRGKNNWRLIVSHGYDNYGNRIKYTKSIHANSRREADKELVKFVYEIENGVILQSSGMTFAQFSEMWAKNYGLKELAPKTYERYKGMLDSRILPYFGHFKLDLIKPAHIMGFYDYLSKDHQIKRCKNNNGQTTLKALSSKTILEHHRLLRAMLQNAVYWQILPYNPVARVKPPKHTRPKIHYYDDKDCKRLLEALEGEDLKFQTIIILTLFTGMRRGEVLALEWSDIDLKEGFVNIDKSSQYLPDKGIFIKSPKTESSVRSVGIPQVVIDILKKYKTWYNAQKKKCGDLWIESNRLFVQWNGKPMHPDTITDWFRRFIERKNLPPITFHGLRHTNATLMISQNVDVAVVASRLGHAQITTTLNFYVHPVQSHNKDAGNILEEILVH